MCPQSSKAGFFLLVRIGPAARSRCMMTVRDILACAAQVCLKLMRAAFQYYNGKYKDLLRVCASSSELATTILLPFLTQQNRRSVAHRTAKSSVKYIFIFSFFFFCNDVSIFFKHNQTQLNKRKL